jgi:hypothetical protein
MTNGAASAGEDANATTDAPSDARNEARTVDLARDTGTYRSMSFMTRGNCAHIGLGVIFGAIALLRVPAVAADLPGGTVVVARSAPTAVFIWDASPAVGDLVVAQQTGDAGMRALEADALAIMAARAPASRARRGVWKYTSNMWRPAWSVLRTTRRPSPMRRR